MAFFGSSKKKSAPTTANKVRPTVIRTENVAKELMSLAESNNVKVDSLGFNILEVQTFTRMSDGSKEVEWEEIEEEELRALDEKTAILNPDFQIKQMYEVEIFSKTSEDDPYKDFHLAIGANATKCKVYLSIKEGSRVKYSSRLEKDLLMLINKSKIRAGIMIDIFDEMVGEAISKISAYIRVAETAVYDKNETVLVAESFEPVPTTNDELIMHFQKKEEVDEKERIDYALRDFIQSVTADELLIEYIKPQIGKPGRNCRGEFIAPEEPLVQNTPQFNVDDTINVVETDTNIEYHAKESGYIAIDGNTYGIKTDVDIQEVSFKTTGSITAGLDSDVSMSVTEKDAVKDAVGNGMEVEVTEINVEGNVGSGAKVSAITATINGQTHKTSEVTADELDINIHKGSAYGKNIHVTRLEHGTIKGEMVDVSQAIGGTIKAKEINIELCGSYVKATASRRIEIQRLQGSENVFTIDPRQQLDIKKGLRENKENIAELENDVKEIKADIEKYTKIVEENMSSFLSVKKRLIHYKKNGVKMPASFVKQYKQFQKVQEYLKGIKEEYLVKNDKLTLLTTRTASFQDNIFDARIINRSGWVGHNELRFKLIDPPIEVTYSPLEGSPEKVFGLVENEDGKYEIRTVHE